MPIGATTGSTRWAEPSGLSGAWRLHAARAATPARRSCCVACPEIASVPGPACRVSTKGAAQTPTCVCPACPGGFSTLRARTTAVPPRRSAPRRDAGRGRCASTAGSRRRLSIHSVFRWCLRCRGAVAGRRCVRSSMLQAQHRAQGRRRSNDARLSPLRCRHAAHASPGRAQRPPLRSSSSFSVRIRRCARAQRRRLSSSVVVCLHLSVRVCFACLAARS